MAHSKGHRLLPTWSKVREHKIDQRNLEFEQQRAGWALLSLSVNDFKCSGGKGNTLVVLCHYRNVLKMRL